MNAYLGYLVVSALAFVVSLFSLWRTLLAPFNLKISYNSPTFTLHKISPKISSGKKTWWIPSVDGNFTFLNLGKKTGEVTDIRFCGKLTSESSDRLFVFYAKWIVDFLNFQQNRDNRLKWLEKSIVREWYPLILVGDKQISHHIIFEGLRWDEKFVGDFSLKLEIFSSKNKEWNELEEFNFQISENMYDDTFTISLISQQLNAARGNLADQWDNK